MSTIATYVKFAPLYEAMSVCSLALEDIKRQEAERQEADLLATVIRCVDVTRKFTSMAKSQQDILSESDTKQIMGIVCCVGILNAMMECAIRKTREALPQISEKYRQALSATLDDCEKQIEEIEGILEAWAIPANEELFSRIKEAMKEIDSSKSEISDWRKVLESVSD